MPSFDQCNLFGPPSALGVVGWGAETAAPRMICGVVGAWRALRAMWGVVAVAVAFQTFIVCCVVQSLACAVRLCAGWRGGF